MLVHLSNTSAYVCDLNRGPIEPANRMASAPTRKTAALLEQKESLPRQVRTPLKLLAPGEIPMDTTITTTDVNASLQPVWYTEQTIVDDHHAQQEDIASIIQEQQQEERKTGLARTTLSPIPSESPIITEDIEELPNQPSLMHKSSTFTIESSINIAEPLLNDSEKENLIKENTTNEINQPSDDSFRALEQLLGLGSTGTVRESPKTNHDTLSLTVVTPTDIINTTRRSSRLSYVQKGGSGSLPSSQDIPVMPTIESITSTEPPSFLMENTTMEDEQPSTMYQQTTFDITDNDTIKDDSNNDDETNFSFELNDFPNNLNNEPSVHVPPPLAEPMITIRAPTCADVAYRALIKPRAGGRISQPVKADSPLAKTNKARSSAPTTRALRSSCRRISSDSASSNSNIQEQPLPTNPECFINDNKLIEIVTLPEEDENEQEKTTSVTLNTSSPKELEENNTYASIQSEQIATPPKPIAPILSREYTYNTPKHRSSQRNRSTLNSLYATPKQTSQQTTIYEEEIDISPITSNSMLQILLTKPTEVQPEIPQRSSIVSSPIRTSKRSTMKKQGNNSSSIVSKSMLQILLTQPTNNESNVEQEMSSIETSTPIIMNNEATNSSSPVSKSMLGILLTQPTEEVQPQVTRKTSIIPSPVRLSKRITMKQQTINSPSIVSKSMLEVLLTKPTEAETSVTQKTSILPSSTRTSKRNTMKEQTMNSSMLGILLTKPTEAETSVIQETSILPSSTRTSKRNTMKEQSMNSSMLGILLTNPVEDEPDVVQNTSIAPSSVEISIRKSQRSSSNPTPRVSINPLHSSTPSASRHKSLQMVSIGEQEQLTTTVPQEVNIEIVPLNDTEKSLEQASTMEIGVQTTPSLDISRRRLNITPQQITPIVIVDEQREITPLQLKGLTNLQRNVRFQLTPSTDARLAIKEQFEENLRGLKPDIVLNPTPIIPEPKQDKIRSVKPKKKVITSKKKRVTPLKKIESKSKSISKKSRQPRKDKNIQKQEPISITKTSNKSPRTKHINSKAKNTNTRIKTNAIAKRAPPKRTNSKATTKRTIPEVSAELTTRRAPPKRTIMEVPNESNVKPISTKSKTKKQANSEVKIEPAIIKQTKPEAVIEPTVKQTATKRAISKTKKESVIIKQTDPEVIIEPTVKQTSAKRATSKTKNEPSVKRAKTSKPVEVKKQSIEAPLNLPRTRSGSTNNKNDIPKPLAPTKTSKRRLESVDKTEKSKKKVKEANISPVENTEINQEESKKIETLTVAELKSRLNKHNENIPKSAKKADLIALLNKIETNLNQNQKEIKTATDNTTAKITRRRKK